LFDCKLANGFGIDFSFSHEDLSSGNPENNEMSRHEITSELSICNSSNKYKTLQHWFETTFAQGNEHKLSVLDKHTVDNIALNDFNSEFEHKDSFGENDIIDERVSGMALEK
jgi:hypothetical protein